MLHRPVLWGPSTTDIYRHQQGKHMQLFSVLFPTVLYLPAPQSAERSKPLLEQNCKADSLSTTTCIRIREPNILWSLILSFSLFFMSGLWRSCVEMRSRISLFIYRNSSQLHFSYSLHLKSPSICIELGL